MAGSLSLSLVGASVQQMCAAGVGGHNPRGVMSALQGSRAPKGLWREEPNRGEGQSSDVHCPASEHNIKGVMQHDARGVRSLAVSQHALEMHPLPVRITRSLSCAAEEQPLRGHSSYCVISLGLFPVLAVCTCRAPRGANTQGENWWLIR